MTKTMPKNIKVGYFNYTVTENANLVEDIGQTKLDKLIIEIDPNYPEQIIKETLLHECLHAILKDAYIIDEELEERLVTMISPLLMLLIKENTELKSFLFD